MHIPCRRQLFHGGEVHVRLRVIIGEIQRVEMETNGLSLYAVVNPAADIQGAKQVFVITDFGGKDDETAQTSAPAEEDQDGEE